MKKMLIALLFKLRPVLVLLYAAATVWLGMSALDIKIDAGFQKQLPRSHPYIKTFLEYEDDFGGANRVLLSVSPKSGSIYTPEFFRVLKSVTEESYYLKGVNRAQIRSLFTPNVRFIEIVDGGFAGGNIVPADFDFSDADIEKVRQNVLKSSVIGRLVANDFSSAMVSMQLSEVDPASGERVNYLEIAEQLEMLRSKFETDDISIEIIGFAKAVGDIADGAQGVLVFLGLTVILVAFLINFFLHSWKLTLIAVTCSFMAVIWNVGLMAFLGYGFDPMSILTPFLIFAIGVSHSLQILNRVNLGLERGLGAFEAAKDALTILLMPGLVALASDTLGFLTIHLIDVPIIQELAVMASLGVLVLVFTNLLLLPLLASYLNFDEAHLECLRKWTARKEHLWKLLSHCTGRKVATVSLAIAAVIFVGALYKAQDLRIGDLHPGIPELREDSRYNQDTRHIVSKYSIGVDLLTIICETVPNACINHSIMAYIDELQWNVYNNPNVQSTLSMPQVMKILNAAWNEGHPKWEVLSRNPQVLVQSARSIETSSGLLNPDCSVIPVMVFLKDHTAETIQSVIKSIEDYVREFPHPDVNVRLATGNAGVMAASNATVAAAQYPILFWIYTAIIVLCLLLFRCARSTACVVLPLALVSVVAYGLMAHLQIGLKTSSLPVAALGVGIGVDYGIYIFSQLARALKKGERLPEAYLHTLRTNGSAVLVTGLTLSLAISTWTLSDLQFQADMGILFASMLFLNMLGALLIVPALAYFLFPKNR